MSNTDIAKELREAAETVKRVGWPKYFTIETLEAAADIVEQHDRLKSERAAYKVSFDELAKEADTLAAENKQLRERLHRSMQLFGNLTLELKKNAAYRGMLAVVNHASEEAKDL